MNSNIDLVSLKDGSFEVKGISLECFGTHEIALPKYQAEQYVEYLIGQGVAILGGDVYHQIGTRIEHALCGWYCEITSDETYKHYVRRSGDDTLSYINRYPVTGGVTNLYVIVKDSN